MRVIIFDQNTWLESTLSVPIELVYVERTVPCIVCICGLLAREDLYYVTELAHPTPVSYNKDPYFRWIYLTFLDGLFW